MGLIARIEAGVRAMMAPPAERSPRRSMALHEAAENTRRLKGWVPTSADINTILQTSGAEIVRRARQVCTQNPYAISAKESFTAHLVGTGIKPASTLDDEATREQVNRAWKSWCEQADADGVSSLYGLMAQIGDALFEAGEMFVRLRPRRLEDGLVVPLQLQCLEAEYLDRRFTEALPNGHQIKSGIEFDRIGRRVAYHFWRAHPGDSVSPMRSTERVRVPAQDVIHVYQVQRPGQLRGMPKIVGGLVRLYNLDQYDDAELERKKVAALLAGFITKPDDEDTMPGITGSEDGSSALSGDGTADGIETVEWQPGTITELALGENIEFSEPTDVGGNYENFMYRNLLAIAAALGVPYVHMTGDVEKANYSNTRAAVIEYRRRITMLQSRVVIHQFCRPVWRRWVEQAVLAGTFRGDAADIADRVKWILPRWDWVDPLKDQQAEALAVEKGFKARADVIEATGEDPAEVDQRRAQDREREQAAGLAPAADSGAGAVDPSEPEERAQVAPRRARGA